MASSAPRLPVVTLPPEPRSTGVAGSERVVAHECPLDPERWDFLKIPTHQTTGHPADTGLHKVVAAFDDPNLVGGTDPGLDLEL